MEPTTFVPKIPNKVDSVSQSLMAVSQSVLVLAIAFTPLFFIPNIPGILGFVKIYFILFLVLISLVCTSLSVLRSGMISVKISPLLVSFWGVVGAGLISALLSPAITASLFGDVLEIHTVGFLAILGLIMTSVLIFTNSKRSILYVYGAILGSAFIVSLLHIVRIIFGAGFLSFGILFNQSDSLVGSFNDLGIFLGLTIILSLVAVVQLSLPRSGMALIGMVVSAALFLLMVVNFFIIWLILSLFSLTLLMYSLTKDRFGVSADSPEIHSTKVSLAKVALIAGVFFVSTIFLIGGSSLDATMARVTGVNYLEIRPSATATFSVMRNVYQDNAFTGSGPNLFSDSWNKYKDSSINSTVFWQTPFSAGSGYVLTWFITAGLLGAVTWIIFLGLFLYSGLQMLVRGQSSDSFWYFAGTTSFATGAYIWLMSVFYVPGPTVLIVGAVSTGIMIIAHQTLLPKGRTVYNLLSSSKTGFILIVTVMIVIISSISVGYGAVRQLMAAVTFSTAARGIDSNDPNAITLVTSRIANAYSLYPSDTYLREIAQYQLLNLNSLLALAQPTAEQQQQFKSSASSAAQAASMAVQKRPSDARNWQMLGDVFGTLSVIKVDGAQKNAFDNYAKAEALNPKNPYYVLQKAFIEFKNDNRAESRRLASFALELKPNYTDALFLITQIDIADGDLKKAITSTQSLISYDASNPGRYYQLGVLQAADNNHDGAISAFTTAIELSPNYANARYFRALQYLDIKQKDLAISELKIIRDMNADNKGLDELINKINSGEVTSSNLSNSKPVVEAKEVTADNTITSTADVPNTDSLTSVNTAPKTDTKKDAPVKTEDSNPTPTPAQ